MTTPDSVAVIVAEMQRQVDHAHRGGRPVQTWQIERWIGDLRATSAPAAEGDGDMTFDDDDAPDDTCHHGVGFDEPCERCEDIIAAEEATPPHAGQAEQLPHGEVLALADMIEGGRVDSGYVNIQVSGGTYQRKLAATLRALASHPARSLVQLDDALAAFFRSPAGAAMGRDGDSRGWTPRQTAEHYGIPLPVERKA